jgi:protein SCO1/2
MKCVVIFCAAMWLCAQASLAGEPISPGLENVRIDQRIGEKVPLDLQFTDEQGRVVELSQYMTAHPVILVMAYYTCPNLCSMLQRHLIEGLNGIGLIAGRDFDVLLASIDPDETVEAARQQKLNMIGGYRYRKVADGWHYLVGDAQQIEQLKQAVGFHCLKDPERKQFRHALGVMVIAPGGKLTHYFLGVDFAPFDLEAALKDAVAGQTTMAADPAQEYCMEYTPSASRYGRLVVHALQGMGVFWVLLMLGYIAWELRRDWGKRGRCVEMDAFDEEAGR